MESNIKDNATVHWKVEGMTCANCALTIEKYLANKGLKQIKVNLLSGDVQFDAAGDIDKNTLIKGMEGLGYAVAKQGAEDLKKTKPAINRFLRYLLLCAAPTLLLMTHMVPAAHHAFPLLSDPWLQLALCLPVYLIGMRFFGRSAWKSIRNGSPNMNVLVSLGATAAFIYSLTGTIMNWGPGYLYYETAASIITLVFLGNYMEDSSIESTQRALHQLARSQKVMAHMIAFDEEHREVILPVENDQLRVGDLLLIRAGDIVPADCKILWGDAAVNESIITGESLPVAKTKKSALLGGSLIADGTVKAIVTAAADNSALANIIDLVKRTQSEKPPVQLLADRISAIFVPVVLLITLITFAANYWVLGTFTEALMRSIAVLVIACPCAMGLATPAAIAVGLGRSARNGILFRNAKSLESFRNIRQVVFDKTGTLTTGTFSIDTYEWNRDDTNEAEFRRIAYSLEKYSNHPIARCITEAFKEEKEIRWQKIEETKGLGIAGTDAEGNTYKIGSHKWISGQTAEDHHNSYLFRNDQLMGWIDVKDEIRPEAQQVITYLKNKGIKTILLSGDRQANCEKLSQQLGMDEVIAEQTPEEKQKVIKALRSKAPTAMVGDGINDAPALAEATIGISLSEASQIAMQTADVVLIQHGLKQLPLALGMGKHTYITIQQNLFWAFFYNVIAIPAAAVGLLGVYGPTLSALIMGFSDVVLAINSVRLFIKKVY